MPGGPAGENNPPCHRSEACIDMKSLRFSFRLPGGPSWHWALPYLAVVLFAVSMLVLVWFLQVRENEVERNALVRDVQWAEQTMRLHMSGTEEYLGKLARELSAGTLDAGGFQVGATQHIANNPELVNIAWVAADETVRWTAPFDTTDWLVGDSLSPLQGVAFERSRAFGHSAYGEARLDERGVAVLELYVPAFRGGTFLGSIVGVYSIERMVTHLIPSWIGEKYRISFVGADRTEFAANSGGARVDESLSYAVVLDPPDNGLSMRVSALRGARELPRALPVALIIGLSLIVLWTLWSLRAHIQRRVRVEKERDRLFNLSLDMLCIMTSDGVFRRCNPAFDTVLGYAPEQMPGKALLDFVHSGDTAATVDELRRLAAGEPVVFECRCRGGDGRYKWLMWSINPVRDEKLLYAVAHDITGRKAAEDALVAEYAFRKSMEESLVTGMRAIDMAGRITYVNPAFCRMVGWSAEELIGATPPFPYWPAEERETWARNLELTMDGKAPSSGYEMRIQRRNGERIDARLYISPLIDSQGAQTGWMASVNDITEPKRIRAALEAAQERFEAVLDGLSTSVFVADAGTDEILYANHAFKVLHGFDAVGRSAREVSVVQPERGAYRVDPRLLSIDELPCELFDGELQHPLSGRWYNVRERATRWVDGRVVRMAIAADITDRMEVEQAERQQEERLHRTARLITMGEMASTLAHELNQPLGAISNYAMGCVKRLQSGEYRNEDLLSAMQKASYQAERAGKIIRRIRDFVRKSEPRRGAVPLDDVIEDAISFAEIDARRAGVKVVADIAPDLQKVSADRIQIEQVVLNLVRNGIDAMKEIGEQTHPLRVRARALDARMVEVAVIDRGAGITEAERERLFTPFFTTKPEGMGMGLSICRSIIEFHEGRLWEEANPDGGTIFRFTLPMESQSEPVAEHA